MYYLYAKDPVFHQVAYGALTLATTIRGFLVTHNELKPDLRRRVPAESEAYIRQIQKLAVTGELRNPTTRMGLTRLMQSICRHLHVCRWLRPLEHGQHILPPSQKRETSDWVAVVRCSGRTRLVAYPDRPR